MRRDLSELNQELSKEFLDYFNAALRSKNNIPLPPSGSGRFTELGYEACLDDYIDGTEGGKVSVTWKILLTPDGSAISIEAVSGADIEKESWEQKAEEFIGSILISVLSGKKQTFFRRSHFAAISGSNLNGEYWLPGYRFAPQFPDDDSHLINAERYLVIDQEIKAVDSLHADELADERAALASAHLSLMTDVGLYKPMHEHKWFLKREEGEFKQYRESTQLIDFNIPEKMPKKGEECQGVKFEGSVFQHERAANNEFRCPEETRKILRGLSAANPAKKSAFDKCALLYQLGLTIGRYYPTVRTSYEYASINAIVQELSKEYSGVSDFIRKNISENVESLLDYMHSRIRSAHWHGGEFVLGGTDHRMDFLTNPAEHVRFNIIRTAHRVIRTSIFNWVMREIADNNT
jgi:hypothetical protein